MWISNRCQALGQVDIKELTQAINRQPKEAWDADEDLRKNLAGNRQTQSLFLQVISGPEFINILKQRPLTQDDVLFYSAWESLHKEVQPIVDYALSHFEKNGVILRIQIARMLPGAKILPHIDSSPLLTSSYRLHVPIKTNDDVHFMVDGERIKMQEGQLYNLNNRVPHWVENRSNEARTHLIIDYLPPENNTIESLKPGFDITLKKRSSILFAKDLPEARKDIILPKIIATSVVRGADKKESHGGIYLIDMNSEKIIQVVDWNDCNIDFGGRGGDRGLRGICFYDTHIYVVSSSELFCFNQDFKIIASYQNPYLQHAHEMVVRDDYIYITSTGFDSVLRFNLKTNVFDKGWLIRIDINGKMDMNQYEPIEPYGPMQGNTTHINNVYIDENGLHVSGRHLPYLINFQQDKVKVVCEIPLGTHNVRRFKEGILYNDTESDQVVYSSTYNYCSLPIINYPEADILNSEFSDKRLARQSFGRGLCTFEEDIIISGSSPSTITAFDMRSQSIIKSINISMDIRNAIHGLEIWPFPVN